MFCIFLHLSVFLFGIIIINNIIIIVLLSVIIVYNKSIIIMGFLFWQPAVALNYVCLYVVSL